MRRILLVLMFLVLFAVPAFAQFDFPNSPTTGQEVTGPGGQVFQWDGTKWVALSGGGGGGGGPFLPLTGGTLTGPLTTAAVTTGGLLSVNSNAIFSGTSNVSFQAGSTVSFGSGVNGITAAPGNNTTLFATTAFVTNAISTAVGGGGPFLPVNNPAFTGTLSGTSATLGALNMGGSGSWNSGGLTVATTSTFNGTTTFPDGSSIVTAGSNNGTAGFIYGFQNSTGVAIGTARTGSTTIGGNMLILGQSGTPALLLQAPGFVPEGAIQFSTGVLSNEWITHNATLSGSTWTAWGGDAEIINLLDQPSTVGATISLFANSPLTVGQTFTPTNIAQFSTSGLNIITGTLFLNGANQFESGTFTPVMHCTGGDPAVSAGSQIGNWWTSGHTLSYYIQIFWNSATGGSGNAYVGTLPFAAQGTGAGQGGMLQNIVITNASSTRGSTRLIGTIFNGQNYVTIFDGGTFGGDFLTPLPCANAFANNPSGLFIDGSYTFQ